MVKEHILNQLMNRINKVFRKEILSIYFTAGFPEPNDTVNVIESLEKRSRHR